MLAAGSIQAQSSQGYNSPFFFFMNTKQTFLTSAFLYLIF